MQCTSLHMLMSYIYTTFFIVRESKPQQNLSVNFGPLAFFKPHNLSAGEYIAAHRDLLTL